MAPEDFPGGYAATEVTGGQLGAILGDTAGCPRGRYRRSAELRATTIAVRSRMMPSRSSQPDKPRTPHVLTAPTVLVDTPLATEVADRAMLHLHHRRPGGHRERDDHAASTLATAQSDESLAFRRVTTSGTMTQTMTALVAQNDGVRVYVTSVASGQRPLDGAALDQLYTTALDTLARG